MSVLHLLGTAGEGGAETYFLDLIAALADDGVKQAAAIRANPNRESALRRLDVPTGVFGFGGPIDLLTRPKLKAFAGRSQKMKDAHAGATLVWAARKRNPLLVERSHPTRLKMRKTQSITRASPIRPGGWVAQMVRAVDS